MAVVLTATFPLRRSTTSQVTPLRFWSTSKSVSIRPFSGLSLIFAVAFPVQVPLRRTSPSLPNAAAVTATRATAATITTATGVKRRLVGDALLNFSPPVSRISFTLGFTRTWQPKFNAERGVVSEPTRGQLGMATQHGVSLGRRLLGRREGREHGRAFPPTAERLLLVQHHVARDSDEAIRARLNARAERTGVAVASEGE